MLETTYMYEMPLSLFNKSFHLLHIHLFGEFSMEEGGGYIHLMKLSPVLGPQCYNIPEGVGTNNWTEGLFIIKSELSSAALGNQSSLVVFHRSTSISLSLENTLAANDLSIWQGLQ